MAGIEGGWVGRGAAATLPCRRVLGTVGSQRAAEHFRIHASREFDDATSREFDFPAIGTNKKLRNLAGLELFSRRRFIVGIISSGEYWFVENL
jgi:hypothetical protein